LVPSFFNEVIRAIAPTEVKRLLTRVSVIRYRTCDYQPEILVGGLISQFSILTKTTNCEYRASPQYNSTQTYQLYLFLVALKNCIIQQNLDYSNTCSLLFLRS
jgi:hypothetical protein